MNHIFPVRVFLHAHEPDHWISEQTLLDHFKHGENGQVERPNGELLGRYRPHQDEIRKRTKKEQ